jgi:hypothetical protein
MSKSIVFYSWQSDSPRRTNRELIEEAIQQALNRIGSDAELEIEPVLDRDTLGEPGSPAIADTIFRKIDECTLFICDVTIVTQSRTPKASPNPNVLIELGYAAARLGWQHIICVMNRIYGGPSKLPFDLRNRRWPIQYSLSSSASDEDKSQELRRLSEEIELAVRTAVSSGILARTVHPKDRRVAIKFENALDEVIGEVAVFLRDCGLEQGTALFSQDYEDRRGTNYPSLSLVDPIVKVYASNTLIAPSNVTVGDQQLTWAGVLITDLRRLAQRCNRILDQYADRDDRLISMVDEIHNRAEQLASMIETTLSVSTLASLYADGVPDVHLEFFQYFFLSVLKSYRVIRQFR